MSLCLLCAAEKPNCASTDAAPDAVGSLAANAQVQGRTHVKLESHKTNDKDRAT